MKKSVQEAMMNRLSSKVVPGPGKIEFLSYNSPEYRQVAFRKFLKQTGFEVCNTPVRSLENNGIAEAFSKSFKQDYVYQPLCETFEGIDAKISEWVKNYNTQAPHSAPGILSPVKYCEKWKQKKMS